MRKSAMDTTQTRMSRRAWSAFSSNLEYSSDNSSEEYSEEKEEYETKEESKDEEKRAKQVKGTSQ